ncbi:phosphatidate phosphatase LPIN3 isoform X2 [Nothoprocta perdicaria]|uniref:phosphatidate phosphatase LPIN3 isoform X2 n=1 Tax=Nothoprocta perdicaria TaxID=30464 RepID=UPI000E1BD54B|nr:phosphatidate phosphatase LPIN3 isoform X2 [Nothoprocta perdicaria]
MNYVGQLAETVFVTVKELYRGLNPATLTGCIDVIVVRQPDNSFQCSPFHVRFGKLGVLRSTEKVVDIEINGEPVDLHMKLGDNGEAFFVQESEENEGSIPSRLCTSPIPMEENPGDVTQAYEGQEASSPEVTLCKRRRRKKKPKRKEVAESNLEGCKGTESRMSLEESRPPTTSDSVYFSFLDLPKEAAGSLQAQEIYPYSDGELASVDSPSLSHPSSPKSDSELEMRPQESFALGTEPHMQWAWGRLPQVNKSERVESAKSIKAISTAAAITSMAPALVDGTTPLVAVSEGLGGVPSPAGLQDAPHSSSVSVVELKATSQKGDGSHSLQDIPSTVGAESLAESSSVLQEEQGTEEQKEEERVVPEVQLDSKPLAAEGAAGLRQVGLECPEPYLESQKRQGSIKKSPHLGPSDVYLEDLTRLHEEQVALYFPRSDTEQNPKPVADPSSTLCVQLPSGLPAESPMDLESDLMPSIALSLCGGLGGSRQLCHEKFMEHIISYQEFAENPGIIDDPNLVILLNKKYYNWAVAAPMVLSLQAFQKNIPASTIDRLVKEKMPKKSSRWWFSWRRQEFPTEEPQPRPGKADVETLQLDSVQQREEEILSSDDEPLDVGDLLAKDASAHKSLPTYKKSLRLSSKQIEKLNLQDGPNEVAFSVTTQYQGTCRCEATIYLWNWDDKVVISDIDGTITKSDALGHILPHLGKDWTHHGIAKLFHKIHLNGYKFLYCSARAIGMAHITKGYLKWVNEQGCALPKGPILLAPSSLFSAFHREVIEKKPEMFKVACLMDIQNLFASKQPFFAAFGNKPNDVYAYKQVGLLESHIFTVNPKGELIQELMKTHKSTYERLSELVELIFPPLGQRGSAALECPEYSHFSYWRPPLPLIDLEDLS